MAGRTQLDLLGEFRVHHDGRAVRLPPSGERLVALLAVRRRPMRRSHAASLLWLETRDRQAAANLRAVLCRLRRCPVPLVTADGVRVGIAPQLDVDLWRVTESAQAAPDVFTLTADVLPGWPEEWLVAERERHRQLRLHGLERACRRLRAAGEYERALEAGLAALADEPLRETAHREVIEVHLAEGNQAEALRQYERYRTQLRRELGLSPSPAIRDLVGRLLGRPADRAGASRCGWAGDPSGGFPDPAGGSAHETPPS